MTTFMILFGFCVLESVAVALFARPMVESAKPSTVVPLLAVGSVISAASMGLLLSLLGLAVLARLPAVAHIGGWSSELLELTEPVPVLIGVVAAGLALALLARMLWRTGRIVFLLGLSDRLSRQLRGSGGPIAFVDTADADADAFTLAGRRGCVVISRRLFAALGPAERQMLTQHELSHLRRRHHLYVHAADIAIAANPALAGVPEAVRLGIERWADEDAATTSGDRAAAAAALANTALIRSSLRKSARQAGPTTGVPVLCIASSHVSQRTRALLSSAPGRSALTALFVGLLIATTAGTVGSTLQIHVGFELAEKSCDHRTNAAASDDPCEVSASWWDELAIRPGMLEQPD